MSSKSFKQLTQDLNQAVGTLRAAQPGTLEGFSAMSKAAMEPGVLSTIDKELMALSIGVAGHCDGCIGFHVKTLVRMGASYQQLTETLAVAVYNEWRAVADVCGRRGACVGGVRREELTRTATQFCFGGNPQRL